MKEWIIEHYFEIIAAIGFGSGGGVFGKKFVEKQRNKEIKNLESRIGYIEQKLSSKDVAINNISNRIDTNTRFDKQFRDEISNSRIELDRRLKGLEEGQTKMFDYIVEIFKGKRNV